MINKLGLLIFILSSQGFTYFNIYLEEPNWRQGAYTTVMCIGAMMYVWEKEDE